MNDIQRAQAKKRRRVKRKATGGNGYGRPVLNEDVAREASPSCKECGGSGVVDLDEEAVCACAQENFHERRLGEIEYRAKRLIWKKGCPKE